MINGFAVGDVCTGTVNRKNNRGGGVNQVTITEINSSSSTTTNPPMRSNSSNLVTNSIGQFVGVFYIPNTEELRFRTGERVFRLIDNVNNEKTTGAFTSTAEKYTLQLVLQKKENRQF